MAVIRTVWAGFNLVLSTFLASALVLLAVAISRDERPLIYDWVPRSWGRWQLWAAGVRLHVEGLDRIKPDLPQVVVSNHESWYDVFALMATLPKRYRFVAKQELRRIPLFGLACQAVGNIWVDRSDHESAVRSLDHAAELLRADNSTVVMFPEGTRSPDGRLLPFRKGAVVLAVHTGAELVPAAVVGSRKVHPKGGWRIRSGQITLRFGEPVDATRTGEADRDKLLAAVRAEVAGLR